jgi:hypothetical protein
MSNSTESSGAHHIWCNVQSGSVSECKQCKRLWEKYPYESESDKEQLAAKNFPEAIQISGLDGDNV